MAAQSPITLGVRVPYDLLRENASTLRSFVIDAEAAGIDRLCVGDHVSFNGGQGFDGLINATAVAVLSDTIMVQTAVYLLPLRHPVPVARQVASLALLAPGRFSFGVGIGGEDRSELHACGVDPATRGRRMDEALIALRPLLAGQPVDLDGEYFQLRGVQVLPPPTKAVPVLIGGRSGAALRRVAVHGDGWLGLWVSADRYAQACAEVDRLAALVGRAASSWQHGMHVWCGFGSTKETSRRELAATMESLYRVNFEKFERYSPYGTAADIAEALQPYVEAGCRSFNLIAGSGDQDQIIRGAIEVRALLNNGAASE